MKKTKKLNLLLLGLMLGINAHAQQVTKGEAVQAATNSIRYEKNGDSNRRVDTVFTKISRNDTILYEVVFDDGNTVILSGNKACIPILGIILYDNADTNSVSGVIDTCSILAKGSEIPEGLCDFLSDYERQVAYCFRNNITGYYDKLWQRLQTYNPYYFRDETEVGPLVSTEWGQTESNDKRVADRDPYAYNALVSEQGLDCEKCSAGCVAVAMAQIMKVWDYPNGNPQKCHDFDWNNMPTALFLQENSNYNMEKMAVAHLLRDCGKLTKMHYCTDSINCGSGSTIDSACYALRMFGYSDVTPLQRSECPNWIPLMINELNNGRPIDYFGKNGLGYGGHSFVCDGYKERLLLGGYKFHFNWGWNGKKNGWFVLDDLTPGNHNFSFAHQAILNIYPTGCYLNIIMECGKVFPSGTNEEYFASDSIQNNGYAYFVCNNATVNLQAGEEILLSDGFLAETGSNFHAAIAPCGATAGFAPENLTDSGAINIDDPVQTKLRTRHSARSAEPQTNTHSLTVYPNPTNDLLHIELAGGAGIANVALYDLQGRTVRTRFIASANSQTATVDMRNVPAGVYMLRVRDAEGKEYEGKVVKR